MTRDGPHTLRFTINVLFLSRGCIPFVHPARSFPLASWQEVLPHFLPHSDMLSKEGKVKSQRSLGRGSSLIPSLISSLGGGAK